MTPVRSDRRATASLVAALVAAACTDGAGPREAEEVATAVALPATVVARTTWPGFRPPSTQRVLAGWRLGVTAAVARAIDPAHQLYTPVGGRTVEWRTEGSGAVSPATTVSSLAGTATAFWTPTGSGPRALVARVDGVEGRWDVIVVADAFRAARVAAGGLNSCALDVAGRAFCWGAFPTTERSPLECFAACVFPRPRLVVDSIRFREIAVAGNSFGRTMCGLTEAGVAYCWGRDVRRVEDAPPTTSLFSAAAAVCGRAAAGDVWCTDSSHRAVATPGAVARAREGEAHSGAFDALSIGTPLSGVTHGDQHACALTADAAVVCWGVDDRGVLGAGVGGLLAYPAPVAPP